MPPDKYFENHDQSQQTVALRTKVSLAPSLQSISCALRGKPPLSISANRTPRFATLSCLVLSMTSLQHRRTNVYLYTILSSSLAYPTTLLIISLSFTPSSSFFASSVFGKYILPSWRLQPCSCANSVTAPSESRNRRFFAEAMGSDGYDLVAHEAISRRMVLIRICANGQLFSLYQKQCKGSETYA